MSQMAGPGVPIGFREVSSELIPTEFGGHYDVTVEPDPELRERLAAREHEQWCQWMGYLFGKCSPNRDGTATIPAWAVERWQRQMITDYANLSEAEKQSDRVEADKVLALMRG